MATFVGSKGLRPLPNKYPRTFKHLGTHSSWKTSLHESCGSVKRRVQDSPRNQLCRKGYNQTLLGVPSERYELILEIRSRDSDYLWIQFVFKVGAYGGMSRLPIKGTSQAFLYRDPNIVETLERYDGQVEYLRKLQLVGGGFERTFDWYRKHDWPSTFQPLKSGSRLHALLPLIWRREWQQFRDEILAATPRKGTCATLQRWKLSWTKNVCRYREMIRRLKIIKNSSKTSVT